jgi:hypothetical protein
MNKWEDSFKKTLSENNGNKICLCSSDQGLFVPNRQLSFIVALLLLLAFSIFMVGYFLGKKKIAEQLCQEVRQEAFADQIYTTLLSSAQDQLFINNKELATNIDNNVISSEIINQNIIEQEIAKISSVAKVLNDTVENIAEQRYYAQLIGFNTEKAAQLFVKKLSTKGIQTEVKKRASKTAKGHTSYWYQVVTTPYSNEEDLYVVVNRIIKEENIKGVSIRNC